jgi:hypothetical protein
MYKVITTIIDMQLHPCIHPSLSYYEIRNFDNYQSAEDYRLSEINRMIKECGYTVIEFDRLGKNWFQGMYYTYFSISIE